MEGLVLEVELVGFVRREESFVKLQCFSFGGLQDVIVFNGKHLLLTHELEGGLSHVLQVLHAHVFSLVSKEKFVLVLGGDYLQRRLVSIELLLLVRKLLVLGRDLLLVVLERFTFLVDHVNQFGLFSDAL